MRRTILAVTCLAVTCLAVTRLLAGCGTSTVAADTDVDAGETGSCLVGAVGCACTPGGSCDPGFDCVGGICTDPECPVGAVSCACTPGGSCDPGLVCTATSTCIDPSCSVGAEGCTCTPGGSCDPGLECMNAFCVDPDGTTDPTNGPDSTEPTTDDETSQTNASASESSSGGESSTTGEPVDLDGWAKRRPVFVDNAFDEELSDIEVFAVLDWDADFAPDLADLRFTNAAGTELLPYWIESFVAPTSASVWVRVPQVPARESVTIQLWYDNPNAVDASDPYATFHGFHDFAGNDLDPDAWIGTGTYQVANGVLTVQTGSVYSTEPLVSMPGFALEASMLWETQGDSVTGIRLASSQMSGVPLIGVHRTGLGMYGSGRDFMDEPLIPTQLLDISAVLNQWRYVGIGMSDDITRFMTNHVNDDDFMVTIPSDYYAILGYGTGSGAGEQNCDNTRYDHVLVRRFARFPPTTFAGAEEDV